MCISTKDMATNTDYEASTIQESIEIQNVNTHRTLNQQNLIPKSSLGMTNISGVRNKRKRFCDIKISGNPSFNLDTSKCSPSVKQHAQASWREPGSFIFKEYNSTYKSQKGCSRKEVELGRYSGKVDRHLYKKSSTSPLRRKSSETRKSKKRNRASMVKTMNSFGFHRDRPSHWLL